MSDTKVLSSDAKAGETVPQEGKVEYVNTFCPVGYMIFYQRKMTQVEELRCKHCKEVVCTPQSTIDVSYIEEYDSFGCSKCLEKIKAEANATHAEDRS